MTRQGRAASSREQAEPVGQAIEDLLHGQDPGPDRRELDRERQAVEPAAQVHDRRPVGGGQLEPARCRRRPLGEQLDRLVLAQLVERLVGLRARQLQRRDGITCSPGTDSGSRLVAITRTPGAALRTSVTSRAAALEQVLAVVHHQQQLLVAQVGEQEGPRLGRGLVAQVQGRQDGVVDQSRVPDLGELDQPRAVGEAAREVGRRSGSRGGSCRRRPGRRG